MRLAGNSVQDIRKGEGQETTSEVEVAEQKQWTELRGWEKGGRETSIRAERRTVGRHKSA